MSLKASRPLAIEAAPRAGQGFVPMSVFECSEQDLDRSGLVAGFERLERRDDCGAEDG